MMTLIIVTILLLAYVLFATESVTNVNKAAVAIFAAAAGWVLYICYGTDFVMNRHAAGYTDFLGGAVATSAKVKQYIASDIFLPYVGRAAEVVLFLLATMTIVEVLTNNGCFDFIRQLLRTRRSRRLMWTLAGVTFALSANLDNLSTTVMMLTIMHGIVPKRRDRMVYGSAITIAANCGGALTVIGNPEGLVLWSSGFVTASNFSMALLAPCMLAWLVPTWMLARMLPERVETEWITMPYRGDDTRLNVWQRLLMLFVGIGGLWFIPTFHNITKLSPFLGALCVLGVLWVVNEAVNRKLMRADTMAQKRVPNVLQYGVLQMMLFVMGMMLALGVAKETGAVDWLWNEMEQHIGSLWIYGLMVGVLSSVVDNFATAISFFTLPSQLPVNDQFWKVTAYCAMAGGNVLCIGSMSGLALMRMERMHVGWYFRHVGWKALLGGLLGMAAMWAASLV